MTDIVRTWQTHLLQKIFFLIKRLIKLSSKGLQKCEELKKKPVCSGKLC